MSEHAETVIQKLRSLGNESDRQGMARFGIEAERAFGVRVSRLRQMAKQVGPDHELALELWASGYHEARLLATLLALPEETEEALLESWVADLYSWDLCDAFITNLARKTPWAWEKAIEWSQREPEFERRAGLAMMAFLAVHEKARPDADFDVFFPYIERVADDNRIYVRKAASWALRQVGKRSWAAQARALDVAGEIARRESKAAAWIARDVRRELTSRKVAQKLERLEARREGNG